MEDLIHNDNYSQYLMQNQREIISTLHKLSDTKHSLVNAYLPSGNSIVTTILSVNNTHLYLDVSPDPTINKKVEAAQSLLCMSYEDKINIQFEIRHIVYTQYEGKPAFKCTLPDILLRLQRREYYRVHTPILQPALAKYAYLVGNLTKRTEVKIIDISGGGMAAVGIPEDHLLAKGDTIEKCEIVLPHIGTLHGNFEVRYVSQVETRSNHFTTKAGLRFIGINDRDIMMIQKYVMHVERERKLRD